MRVLLQSFLMGFVLFGMVAAYSQLIANSRLLAGSQEALRLWSQVDLGPDAQERAAMVDAVARRAHTYEDAIEGAHLIDGMLVNRTTAGGVSDECDSLLFSALRFVALKKLGLDAKADGAWTALEKSQSEGLWVRHPRCNRKATSRDMVMGLLIALSQRPERFAEHARELVERVRAHDGFFGNGPLYVSYLTPNIAKFLRLVALASGIDPGTLPAIVREGYSTAELSLLWIRPGFEAHLVGLSAWLELELLQSHPYLRADASARMLGMASSLTAWASDADLDKQRLQWTTAQLVALDPDNLFFRYLRLRAAGALTHKTAAAMMSELLLMPQFPDERLPRDCDRRADYLWQRGSWEHRGRSRCHRIFNGTDYLWMAGLLVEALGPGAVYTQSR